MTVVPLTDIAKVIRSKNAGPFLTTIDVMFHEDTDLDVARISSVFTPQGIADLYGLDSSFGIEIHVSDSAKAIKVTMPSRFPSGDFRCTDIYGAQQYVPLLAVRMRTDP